jgi:hypothetical protein
MELLMTFSSSVLESKSQSLLIIKTALQESITHVGYEN